MYAISNDHFGITCLMEAIQRENSGGLLSHCTLFHLGWLQTTQRITGNENCHHRLALQCATNCVRHHDMGDARGCQPTLVVDKQINYLKYYY